MENLKNKTMSTTWIIIGSIVVLLAIILVGMYWHYNNKEINLRNRAQAQEKNIAAVHDEMWKTIQQEAGVANEYAAQFDSIYKDIMSGRYSNTSLDGDGSLMKWIQESNPDFSPELYANLQASIEALRAKFANEQKTMLDLIREHQNVCEQMPGKFFVSNKSAITYDVITSTRTEQVLVTRRDDDVDIF